MIPVLLIGSGSFASGAGVAITTMQADIRALSRDLAVLSERVHGNSETLRGPMVRTSVETAGTLREIRIELSVVQAAVVRLEKQLDRERSTRTRAPAGAD